MNMALHILVFGALSDITGTAGISWPGVEDTDTLRRQLSVQYPQLATIGYRLAVNKQLVAHNLPLADGMEIALLPPFSGG